MRKVNNDQYEENNVDLEQHVTQPSYGNLMNQLKIQEDCNVIYDFWARGNYLRRVISNRKNNIQPLLVEVREVNQARWAFRRLALLGLPVEFIYPSRNLNVTRLLSVITPSNEFMFDAGWGYLAVPTKMKHKRKPVVWLISNARLLPESFLDWIVNEVSDEFVKGDVFVTPDLNIGLDIQEAPHSLNNLSTLYNGLPIPEDPYSAEVAFTLELPFIDQMDQKKYRKFLKEHENNLTRFRLAFKKLIASQGKSVHDPKVIIDGLKYEIAELTNADKYKKTRKNIVRLGGVLSLFSISLAIMISPDTISTIPAIATAAGTTLINIWNQAINAEEKFEQSPYSILWKLGMTKSQNIVKKQVLELSAIPKPEVDQINIPSAHHWLCPPSAGVRFIFNEEVRS